MAGEGIAAQQMLQQQAALEQRNAGMQNMMKQQAASQIMRQIAMGEIQREMAMEAQTGRSLESAAGSKDRRDVGKSRMETQKELEEKQRLLGLIGGAAEATGALGGYLVSQQALEDAQFQGRVEKAALNPEVDDMSQFNPQDVEALQAMSQEQNSVRGTFPMNPDKLLSTDDLFPRDAGSYETDVIRGMVDPRRGMPLSVEGQQTNKALERKNRRIREQLRALRVLEGGIGSAPANPYLAE